MFWTQFLFGTEIKTTYIHELKSAYANLINTMYDSTLSTIYTMYNRPHNTEMTDGYTFNPLLQAESTLLGILQQTQKRLIFLSSNIRFVISMFKRVEPPLGEVTVTNQGH